MIRVALLGDIVGVGGCRAVAQQMPVLRERYRADLVIANAENAAGGSGLTPTLYQRLVSAGVDGMTLGDHVFKKDTIVNTLQREPNIIRPANLPMQAAGKQWMRLRRAGDGDDGPAVYVVTVLGRLFMSLPSNDPFATAEAVVAQIPEADPIVLLEVHAEATSEKQALGWYFNGRVACVFGTHTHVPTNDARILPPSVGGPPKSIVDTVDAAEHPTPRHPGGTAYITDLGMCGPIDSVLGRRVDRVLHHMATAMHAPFDVAEGPVQVQGALVEIDETSRRATHIEPIKIDADLSQPPFI
jgi:metallophosphoesterase (TIGR00282 family)